MCLSQVSSISAFSSLHQNNRTVAFPLQFLPFQDFLSIRLIYKM